MRENKNEVVDLLIIFPMTLKSGQWKFEIKCMIDLLKLVWELCGYTWNNIDIKLSLEGIRFELEKYYKIKSCRFRINLPTSIRSDQSEFEPKAMINILE